ncbi:MAG: metal-dependent transcriptional regulator, partial [Gemmatimonadaceae bacterium]
WDRVHDEAERLEHAASDDLIECLSAAMGHPTADPHGAPIPTRDGRVDERAHHTLAELPLGQRARMVLVSDKNADLLRYLADIALQPGTEVTVTNRAPFDGPITLRVGKKELIVGAPLASQVLVEPIAMAKATAKKTSPSTRKRTRG